MKDGRHITILISPFNLEKWYRCILYLHIWRQIISSVLEKEGAVAQSVEYATPGEEVLGSKPAVAACSLLVGSVSV